MQLGEAMSKALFALGVVACTLSAQTFEVASVKRSATETGSGARSTGAVPKQQEPTRIDYPHVTLKAVIAVAYGVVPDQISGPQWLGDERYDISAKLPDGASPNQTPVMLQHLLADRFHMAAREEARPGKGFALVAAKIRSATGEESAPAITVRRGRTGVARQRKPISSCDPPWCRRLGEQ